MTEFAQIDVKEIQCAVPRAQFAEEQIAQLADLILAGGGVLRPLVVKQVDIDRYELLDGAFEYYGAIRAREKEPRQGELVSAFVVSRKTEAAVQQQLELLHTQSAPTSGTTTMSVEAEQGTALDQAETSQLSAFISNFVVSSEARISAMREELFQSKRTLETRVEQLEKTLGERESRDLLQTVNSLPEAELMAQLSFYIDATRAKAICAARAEQADGRFQNYLDLLTNTKGLGEKGLIRLIDRWLQMHK